MFESIKKLTEKLPSIKTVGLVAVGVVSVAAVVTLGCVATAVQSDLGHEVLDLF